MQRTILESNQTQTSETNIICETFSGTWLLCCVKYTGSPVKVQVKVPGGTQWQDCVFAGKLKELTDTCEDVELPITPCFQYRVITETAGAEVVAFADIAEL